MLNHIQAFLNSKRQLAPNTRTLYTRTLRLFAAYTGAAWPVTPAQIDDYLDHLKQTSCTDGGVHAHYRVLRSWFNWLEQHQQLENPIKLVTEPPQPKPLPHAPRQEHLQAFFRAIAKTSTHPAYLSARNLALFHLLLETGLRISELCDLNLTDLDLTHRTADIHQTKTNIARQVIFDNAMVIKYLHQWMEVRQALPIPPALDYVFVGYQPKQKAFCHLSPQAVRNARDKYIALANIKTFRLHDLRHAFGVYSLRARMDLIDIKNQLGHTSLATTMRYTLVADSGRAERHALHSPTTWLSQGGI